MPWRCLSGGTLPVKSRISRKTNLLNEDFADAPGGKLVVLAATMLATGAKSMFEEWMVLDVGKLTRAALEAV